ncbi:MAG: hypothetical protein J6S92_00610 [Oscillospiraceae bacterium]|nr:hypothetical protein [Oscillospiraceae bacterium]MBP0986773.1 hypothetical protein [Oscillospiraceae bacterium]
MIGVLPETLDISGRSYGINADFRNVLRIFDAFQDAALTDAEKAYICVQRLYTDSVPAVQYVEAVERAYWFCGGGDIPKSEPEPFKMLDWTHDEQIMIPAVSRAAGVPDIRTLPFLHWWTFLGLFGEIGEGLFSTVLHIRQKLGRGEKLEKWEQKYLKHNKELIRLRTAEEQAAIAETEAFLKTIT